MVGATTISTHMVVTPAIPTSYFRVSTIIASNTIGEVVSA